MAVGRKARKGGKRGKLLRGSLVIMAEAVIEESDWGDSLMMVIVMMALTR